MFRVRAAAGTVDLLLVAAVYLAVVLPLFYGGLYVEAIVAGAILALINPFFFAFTISQFGATPGKRLFWIRVAQEDGRLPGFGRALLRVVLKPPFIAAVGAFAYQLLD